MSRQVTVRLPEDLVVFIDECVATGASVSRATVVASALERARRRAIAERDVAILAATGGDSDEFDELARFAAGTALGDLA